MALFTSHQTDQFSNRKNLKFSLFVMCTASAFSLNGCNTGLKWETLTGNYTAESVTAIGQLYRNMPYLLDSNNPNWLIEADRLTPNPESGLNVANVFSWKDGKVQFAYQATNSIISLPTKQHASSSDQLFVEINKMRSLDGATLATDPAGSIFLQLVASESIPQYWNPAATGISLSIFENTASPNFVGFADPDPTPNTVLSSYSSSSITPDQRLTASGTFDIPEYSAFSLCQSEFAKTVFACHWDSPSPLNNATVSSLLSNPNYTQFGVNFHHQLAFNDGSLALVRLFANASQLSTWVIRYNSDGSTKWTYDGSIGDTALSDHHVQLVKSIQGTESRVFIVSYNISLLTKENKIQVTTLDANTGSLISKVIFSSIGLNNTANWPDAEYASGPSTNDVGSALDPNKITVSADGSLLILAQKQVFTSTELWLHRINANGELSSGLVSSDTAIPVLAEVHENSAGTLYVLDSRVNNGRYTSTIFELDPSLQALKNHSLSALTSAGAGSGYFISDFQVKYETGNVDNSVMVAGIKKTGADQFSTFIGAFRD